MMDMASNLPVPCARTSCDFPRKNREEAKRRLAPRYQLRFLDFCHQATPRPLSSGKMGLMPKHLSAEDIIPLVDCLSPDERLRLLQFISM